MPKKKIFERLRLPTKQNVTVEKIAVTDFEKIRSMYDRMRHLPQHADLDALLTVRDNIAAHMGSSARDAKDAGDLIESERQIEELYQKKQNK